MVHSNRKLLHQLSEKMNPSNLLAFQLIITMLCIFQSWIFQYRNMEGNAKLIDRVSFQVSDPPFMINPENLSPILYKHFFGDWQNLLDVANQPNPYLLPSGPSQTPPLGNLFLNILGVLGPRYSFAIFSLVTLTIWVWLFRKALQNYPWLYAIMSLGLYFILALPTIHSFDRGSLHILAIGLIGVAWLKYCGEKYSYAGILFILAVSMKPQLSIFLLLLLLTKDYRNIIRVVLATISLNFVLFFYYVGQPFKSLIGYLDGTLFFASSNSSGYILDSTSLMGLIIRRIESAFGSDYAAQWMIDKSSMLMLPGLTLILMVLPVLYFSSINQRVKIFLVFSLFSLVVPASQHYTLTWASLAIIPFLTDRFNFGAKVPIGAIDTESEKQTSENEDNLSRMHNWQVSDFLSLITITFILMPSFALQFTGTRNIPISRDFYPYLVVLTILSAYLEYFVILTLKKKSKILSEIN